VKKAAEAPVEKQEEQPAQKPKKRGRKAKVAGENEETA
jgi:hypothetical protein